jgi:hypothetical protein
MRIILEANSTPIVWEVRVRKVEWVKRWRRQDLVRETRLVPDGMYVWVRPAWEAWSAVHVLAAS